MRPADFALYDTLNCAATAIDEAESGRLAPAPTGPRMADAAWQAAVSASCGAFPAGSDAGKALSILTGAADPVHAGEPGRALLWNALHAASPAILLAMAGDTRGTAMLLDGLDTAASMLAPELRDAMKAVADAIGLLAMTAVTALCNP